MERGGQVIAVGHECDLAVLSVEDEDFWVGTCALEFGHVPELQQSVVVVGFPTGGDNLCVTAGVVSRVDVHESAPAPAPAPAPPAHP